MGYWRQCRLLRRSRGSGTAGVRAPESSADPGGHENESAAVDVGRGNCLMDRIEETLIGEIACGATSEWTSIKSGDAAVKSVIP